MYLKPRAVVVCLTFLTAVPGSSTAQAQSQALIDKVKAVIAADTPRLEATFKDLHAHPELGNNAQLAERLGWLAEGRFGEQDIAWLGAPGAPTSAGALAARQNPPPPTRAEDQSSAPVSLQRPRRTTGRRSIVRGP